MVVMILLLSDESRLVSSEWCRRPTTPLHSTHASHPPSRFSSSIPSRRVREAQGRRHDGDGVLECQRCRLLVERWRHTFNLTISHRCLSCCCARGPHASATAETTRVHHSPSSLPARRTLLILRPLLICWELPLSPGLHSRPSRRRSARRIAHVHASSLDLSAAFHSAFAPQQGLAGGGARVSGSLHPERLALITSGA